MRSAETVRSRELRLLSPYEPHSFIEYNFPYDGDDGPAEPITVERPTSTKIYFVCACWFLQWLDMSRRWKLL